MEFKTNLYYYVNKKEAATIIECGLKLSAGFDKEVIIDGSHKKCITALVSPYDDYLKLVSEEYRCLKLEVAVKFCYVADRDLRSAQYDTLSLYGNYFASILPVDQYVEGLYENPEYLITCTLLSEQIHVANRKLFSRYPEGNNTIIQPVIKPVHYESDVNNSGHRSQIGVLLLAKGLITEQQLSEAIEYQSSYGGRL